jgi:hypothetical protein
MRKVYIGARRPLAIEDWCELGWGERDATRLAEVAPRPIGPFVLVATADRVEPLPHHVCHSPSGFEWGYDGNGPSELARCILIDYLADANASYELLARYQEFKDEVITNLPRVGIWSLASRAIAAWAASGRRQAHQPTRNERGPRAGRSEKA